jgi:hypothetical protein
MFLMSHDGVGEPADRHERDEKGTLISHGVGYRESVGVQCYECP